MASSAVSTCSSRASWLTHAEISATAGRRVRSRSSAVGRHGRWRRRLAFAARPRGSPRRWRLWRADRRRLGTGSARAAIRGARWEMPRMARSGNTWRTGMSTRIARRSRHAATERATPRALGRSERESFSRSHASSGAAPLTGFVRSSSHASSTHCGTARRGELGHQQVVQLRAGTRRRRRRTASGRRTAAGGASR